MVSGGYVIYPHRFVWLLVMLEVYSKVCYILYKICTEIHGIEHCTNGVDHELSTNVSQIVQSV